MFEEFYVYTLCTVYVAPNLCFIFLTNKNIQREKERKKERKNKTDANTMYGNTSLTVTQKSCGQHYHTSTINNSYYVKDK